jgi:nucleotide-binding universal stress UspA family protein
LVGSTTVAVTGHAHCPVVVVRETEPPRSRPGGVVVGVDGSESSLLALAFAVSWAAVRSLPVHVLRSWTPPSWAWAPNDLNPDEVSRLERQALDDLLTEWRTRQPDVELTATVLADHPAAALVDASRRAQLVVVGSRGRGGLRGMLLGSVSQQLLHHAEGPVAVVRELAQADAAPAAR